MIAPRGVVRLKPAYRSWRTPPLTMSHGRSLISSWTYAAPCRDDCWRSKSASEANGIAAPLILRDVVDEFATDRQRLTAGKRAGHAAVDGPAQAAEAVAEGHDRCLRALRRHRDIGHRSESGRAPPRSSGARRPGPSRPAGRHGSPSGQPCAPQEGRCALKTEKNDAVGTSLRRCPNVPVTVRLFMLKRP